MTVFGLTSVIQDETYALATLPGSLNTATDTILGTYADRRGAATRADGTAGWFRAGYTMTKLDESIERQEQLYYSQAGFRLFSAGLSGRRGIGCSVLFLHNMGFLSVIGK